MSEYTYSMKSTNDYVKKWLEKIKWGLCEEQGVEMHINKDVDAQLFMQRALLCFVPRS